MYSVFLDKVCSAEDVDQHEMDQTNLDRIVEQYCLITTV